MHQPNTSSRRAPKRVHFKRDSVLEEVIEHPQSQTRHYHGRQDQLRKSQQERSLQRKGTLSSNEPKRTNKTLTLVRVPPLFRCASQEEIQDVLKAGKGAVTDVFQGFNALHWYCNAKSTSPSIIQELLRQGIGINDLDQQTRTQGPIIRHTALGYACRNANVKAVHTLLQNGADPHGIFSSLEA
ncbi:hypothetical protein GGR51DRAFT_562081 [Nemania sp. FL0031]|nr:hypothetical protein GGR51DRAFT_562081 [Nemania sp. FL0031]